MDTRKKIGVWVSWILQLVAAFILGQTLFFKFSGAPESIYIFETLGAEPWGRYVSGLAEFVAVILLLVPRTAWMGAVLGAGVISGAIVSHVFVLGIEVQGDGGLLFTLAVLTLSCCVGVVFIHRDQIAGFLGNRLGFHQGKSETRQPILEKSE